MPVPSTVRGVSEAPTSDTEAAIIVRNVSPPFVYAFSARVFDDVEIKGKVGSVSLDGRYWIPVPTKIGIVGGAGNVEDPRMVPSEKAQYAARELDGTRDKDEVWIRPDSAMGVVPAEYLPAGVAPGSYRRRLRVRAPGSDAVVDHYVSAWDGYEIVTRDTPAIATFDRNNFHLWIASLVLAGKIPPAHPALVRQAVSGRKRRVTRVSALPLADADRKSKVGAADANAKAAEAAKVLVAA